jgi:hypothetical protein
MSLCVDQSKEECVYNMRKQLTNLYRSAEYRSHALPHHVVVARSISELSRSLNIGLKRSDSAFKMSALGR